MAKKKTRLDDVMKELKAIKKLVLKSLQIEMEDMVLLKKTTKGEAKLEKTSKKILETIPEWQQHIWEECQHKKMISGKDEFNYICKLLKKNCDFGSCPLNIKKRQ